MVCVHTYQGKVSGQLHKRMLLAVIVTLGYGLKGDSAAKRSAIDPEVIGPVLLAVVFLFPPHSFPPIVLRNVL